MQYPEDSSDARSEDLAKAISQMRIIVIVLAAGSLLFAGIAAWVNAANGSMFTGPQLVPIVIGSIAAVMIVFGLVIGAAMARGLDAKARDGEQLPIGQISGVVITNAALIEGPALLGAVAGLLGGPVFLLITLVGAAILIVQWLRLPDRMRDMAGMGATYTWR